MSEWTVVLVCFVVSRYIYLEIMYIRRLWREYHQESRWISASPEIHDHTPFGREK